MKTSKRISALLLAICLLAGMAIPMVSADAPQVSETVTYDFDYNTIRQEAGIKETDNGVFADKVQGHINNTLYGSYINWKCFDKLQTASLTSVFNNTANGHLEFRAAKNDWIAFEIDNPGAGSWSISFVGYESKSNARTVNVYIIEKSDNLNVADNITEGNLVGTITFTSTSGTETRTSKKINDNYTFEENKQYVVALQSVTETTATGGFAGRAWICLKELQMTKSSTDAAAEINDAILGSKLTLQSSVTTEEALMLKNGVTLDLNGQALNAASVNCVKGSQIMDSSENDSAVVTVTGSFAAGANNKELPLKTAEKSYRFFAYTLASQGATDYNAENDSAKYWFSLTFDNDDAYDLISGGAALTIRARLGWKEDGVSKMKWSTPEAAFYSQWAAAAKGNPKMAINLTVIGIHKVESFNVMPKLEANGVDLLGSAITYTAS